MPSQDYAHVADLYDIYVNTTFDIPYWLSLAKKSGGEVLELMCGTGRVTLPLLEAGYKVTAIDNSPELLAVLNEKLEKSSHSATIHQLDVSDFDLAQQFDLIILPFNSFAELLRREHQIGTLQTIRKHLKGHGEFVCTLHNPTIRLASVDDQLRFVASYPSAEGKLLFWIHQRYHQAESLVEVHQFYEEYDLQGILQRKRMLNMSFRIIDQATFSALAEEAGLKVTALYGDYEGNPYIESSSPFMIWYLTKQ